MSNNLYHDFISYSNKHLGISSMQLHYWDKLQETLYNNPMVSNSLTPMILEERELRVTQMSVFDRLMMDNIIWLSGPVNDRMSTIVQAQLMFLDDNSSKDIKMYIDTPGGSVKSGLSIIDTMEYINSDIQTINTGMAASMGAVLLGAGKKGKRYSLPNSRVMIHQVSSGFEGTIIDIEISVSESKKYNEKLFTMLGNYTNKDPKQVKIDADRDFWMSSEEALDYGIIDGIITKKK